MSASKPASPLLGVDIECDLAVALPFASASESSMMGGVWIMEVLAAEMLDVEVDGLSPLDHGSPSDGCVGE